MQILSSRLLNKSVLFFGLILFALASCEKDPQLNDSSLNPGNELTLAVTDSTPLVAYTINEIARDGKNQSVTPLGRIVDDRFGSLNASFYANFRLTVIGFDPGDNVSLDSAYLTLAYNQKFGPASSPFNIEVLELNENLVAANEYRNNTTLSTKSTIIGSLSNFTLTADSGIIKIPLTTTFAQSLVDQFGTGTLSSNDNFQNFFKGVHVRTTIGDDALAYLQLTNTNTAINLYFTAQSSQDSLYRFLIDNQATRVNKYEKDFALSEVEGYLDDNTNNDEEIFVSAFSGTKAVVEMPDLSFLGNAIINRAEISFYEIDLSNPLATSFPSPDNLFLFLNLNDSTVNFLPGVSTNNLSNFGGSKRPATVNGISTNEYKFNITRYLQEVINGTAQSNSVILSVVAVNSGNRLKLGGGNHPDLPIRLKVVYTLAQ